VHFFLSLFVYVKGCIELEVKDKGNIGTSRCFYSFKRNCAQQMIKQLAPVVVVVVVAYCVVKKM
jgi:hypothetical protein